MIYNRSRVRRSSRQVVTVTESTYSTEDEVYSTYFTCDRCKSISSIQCVYNYCPECGAKVIWAISNKLRFNR